MGEATPREAYVWSAVDRFDLRADCRGKPEAKGIVTLASLCFG